MLGAAIGGGIGFLGNMIGGALQRNHDEKINAANMMFAREEAQKNRDWQAEMSNSAYQRSTEDMRKAGLNPIMAVAKPGASTPGGAQAHFEAKPSSSYERTGQSARQLADDLMSIREREANIKASEAAKDASKATAVRQITEAKHTARQSEVLEDEGKLRRLRAKEEEKFVPYDSWMKRIGEGIGIIGTGFGNFMRNIGKGGAISRGGRRRDPRPRRDWSTNDLMRAGSDGLPVK